MNPHRFLRAAAWTTLACGCAAPAFAAGVHAGFQSQLISVSPGDTFTVEIRLDPADAPINAFDASVRFDPARLTFVPTTPVAAQRGPMMTSACASTFHVFNARPDSLAITLSLLCNGITVTGPGVVYRVKFAAGPTPGVTTLTLGPSTRFYNAGMYVTPLATSSLRVEAGQVLGVGGADAARAGPVLDPPRPNPLVGRRGILLTFTLPSEDDVRVELLDLVGRRMDVRRSQRFGAGRGALEWTPTPPPPGFYLLRMVTGSGSASTRPLVVVR